MARLTSRFLEGAKGQSGRRLEWADDGLRGLYFRCTAAGEKSWSVRYRLNDGSQRRLTLGKFPALSRAAARSVAMDILVTVGAGRDPAAEVRKSKRDARRNRISNPQTFADLWTRYNAAKRPTLRPKTVELRLWLYQKHLSPGLGKMRLTDLDRQSIRDALRAIGQTAPVTANRAQSLVAAVFNWAVEEGLVAKNPAAGMARLFAEQSRTTTPQGDHLKATWRALNAAGADTAVVVSPRLCRALQLALLTVTRGGDVVGLHAREIDPGSRLWVVPGSRAKGGVDHAVPLSGPAWHILEICFGSADPRDWRGFAFPHARDADAPMDRHSLTRAMARIVDAYGLADVTPHDFRRAASTLIASEHIGALPHIVSALLAHKPEGPAVTQVYNRHRYDREKRAALDAWATYLMKASVTTAHELSSPSATNAERNKRPRGKHGHSEQKRKVTRAPAAQAHQPTAGKSAGIHGAASPHQGRRHPPQ